MSESTHPNRAEIERRFVEKVALHLDLEKNDLKPEATLIDDLGLDTLSLVELILIVEDEFTLDIPDEDTESIRTVKDCIDYIERACAKTPTT